MKKEKIRDFFFALQELVEFHFESPSIAKAPEISPVPARREFKQSDWSGHPNLLENTKREVLRAKELHNDDDNLLNDSNFMDDICLKKFGETKQPPKHDTLDKKQGSNKKKGGSRHKSPDSVNKENRFDNSKLSSNEVFDISQNSVSDLLGTKLGVTKLKLQKETSPVNPESSKGEFYLHFFQPRSNKLHLITQKGDNFVKETMELGEFIVPRYHKSLLTTEGVIILTGGFVDERPSKLSYLLDIDRNLMTEICEMNMGRTGHCILGHAGLIYVIGGVGEDGSTTETCEVFSPQLNTWSHIANLNFGCHSACAISINGSIVKFAGKSQEGEIIQAIERFNGREWLEVKFDRSKLRLFSSSIVFQINKHEVMIVGGTEEEYENKTSECFILSCKDLEKNNSVGVRKGPALPIREGFWSQEVEELNGSLYMLQNVAHQRDKNSVLLDQRRLLQFDAEAMEWNVLNVN